MKTFVINLEKDVERKKSIQKQLQEINLDAEFTTAVYGKELTDKQLNEVCPDFDKIALTLGEVGCSMSHLKIYKKMIDSNIPVALILEDDIIIDDTLIPVLSALENPLLALSSSPCVFLLNKTNEYFESFKKPLVGEHHIVNVIDSFYTFGYILNLAAAKNLAQYLQPVRFVADDWKLFQEQGIIKLKSVIPPVINASSSFESSIGDRERELSELDKENRKRSFITQIKLTLWRVFIRHWLKRVKV